jgi:SRSO17 transposase
MKVLSQNARGYLNATVSILSRPKKAHCLVYLCGLIWLVKFRSIRTIAERFGRGDTDGLHHFARHSAEGGRRMTTASQDYVAGEIRGQDTSLILDDTATGRNGKRIEGIGWHHSAKGIIKGLCAVTAVVRAGGKTWAWDIIAYHSRKSVPAEAFRSKVEIAVDIIRRARETLGPRVTVLMDTWYSCCVILNLIMRSGWRFVVGIKSNRNVIVDGKKTAVRDLAKAPQKYEVIRLSKKKTFRTAKLIVLLPKVGLVALFISWQHKHKTPRFFITNDLSLTPRQMTVLYDDRFKIEFFHKDIKQHLGFGELFVRSRHCVQTHWTLVVVAYNLVNLLSPEGGSRNFRRKVERLRDRLPAKCLVKFKFSV